MVKYHFHFSERKIALNISSIEIGFEMQLRPFQDSTSEHFFDDISRLVSLLALLVLASEAEH